MKATKKPITIEFFPCEMEYLDEIVKWSTEERPVELFKNVMGGTGINITTLEGVMQGSSQDMIIKGIDGEVYPCKKDIFLKTYDVTK